MTTQPAQRRLLQIGRQLPTAYVRVADPQMLFERYITINWAKVNCMEAGGVKSPACLARRFSTEKASRAGTARRVVPALDCDCIFRFFCHSVLTFGTYQAPESRAGLYEKGTRKGFRRFHVLFSLLIQNHVPLFARLRVCGQWAASFRRPGAGPASLTRSSRPCTVKRSSMPPKLMPYTRSPSFW